MRGHLCCLYGWRPEQGGRWGPWGVTRPSHTGAPSRSESTALHQCCWITQRGFLHANRPPCSHTIKSKRTTLQSDGDLGLTCLPRITCPQARNTIQPEMGRAEWRTLQRMWEHRPHSWISGDHGEQGARWFFSEKKERWRCENTIHRRRWSEVIKVVCLNQFDGSLEVKWDNLSFKYNPYMKLYALDDQIHNTIRFC